MLSAFRAFAKSWVAAVLIGLLIVAFAVFGIRDVFGARVSDAVVTAGSRHVLAADFRRAFEDTRQRAEQRAGQPITAELAAANGLDRQVLHAMATGEAFAALLEKIGLKPSDKLVAQELSRNPAFFDPMSGRFSKQTYEQRLAQNGIAPERFEGGIRDEIAERHLVGAIMNSLLAPRAYSAMAALFGLESRDISYLSVEPQNVAQPAPPTDAELTAFMKENAAQLTAPEYRVLTVARFNPQMVGASVAIDPTEVRKRYDFRKDTLGAPETRTVVQIPAKDAAAAQAISARLARNEAPAVVAKSVGVDAVTYDNKPQTAIVDRKVAQAAFQMTAGQVATIQGDLGTAVVKVMAITAGKPVTFEEARPAIEAELRKDAASEKVYALTQAYDDAHTKGANLSEAAAKAGVPTTTLGPVSKDGRDTQGQPVQGLSQKLMDSAFSLPLGGESELVDAGGGDYFAVRVEKVIPPAMPPLAAIKPQLTRAWLVRQLAQRVQAKAEELAARVRKGESLEAVAASTGVRLVRVPGVSRQNGPQNPLVSEELLGNAFFAKPGDVFTARERGFGLAVGRVDAAHPGDPMLLARTTEQARGQMTSTLLQEIGAGAQSAAQRKMKVQIDENRARTAIGLAPVNAKGKPEPAK